MLPDHVDEEDMDEGVPPTKVTIGGETYHFVERLGGGGVGQVSKYEFDTGAEVAVKITNNVDLLKDGLKEVKGHKAAQAKGANAHVLGMKSAFRLPDGNLAIAMEVAPHGDADQANLRINSALANNSITPDQAKLLRLTIAKDALASLAYLRRHHIVHNDVKGANFLATDKGVFKISDFGESTRLKHGETHIDPLGLGKTPDFIAPEILKQFDQRDNSVPNGKNPWIETLKETFPHANEAALKALAKSIKEKDNNDLKISATQDLFYNDKADVWSLGRTLYESFGGKIGTTGFTDQHRAARLVQFMEDKNIKTNPLSDIEPDLTNVDPATKLLRNAVPLGKKIGDPNIDDLLSSMLQGDPIDRPSARKLVQHKVFEDPRIGAKATRELLLAVIGGDESSIKQAAAVVV